MFNDLLIHRYWFIHEQYRFIKFLDMFKGRYPRLLNQISEHNCFPDRSVRNAKLYSRKTIQANNNRFHLSPTGIDILPVKEISKKKRSHLQKGSSLLITTPFSGIIKVI